MLNIFIFALVLGSALGDAVIELTDSDFDSVIAEHDTLLVMFYAPWCGHCKKLKPEFEQAASILLSNDPPVSLAKVDCTEGGKDTCNRFEVRGYPTVKIFKGGEVSQEYNGPRDANGIVKHMAAQVGPASKELTKDTFDKFLEKPETSIVGFLTEGGDLKAAFEKVSDKLREKYRFGHTSDPTLLEKHGSDVVVLFRPKHLKNTFEESSLQTDSTDKAEIEAFIKKNYHGLAGHRTTDNAADFKVPLIIAYYNVDYLKNPKGTNYWRNRVMKVAKSVGSGVTFAVSQHNDFQHELEEYGRGYVSGDKPVICARDTENKKYVMEAEFSMEALEAFVNDFKAGKLEPHLKSEEVPSPNDGPVTVAVAKNFDDVVNNNDKDTLIEFYAPWCGHCKKLTPIYDELGEAMKSEPEIAIVKMDATANDVPSTYDVRGFPTLYFAPKDSKHAPKKYEGGRELDDFTKYLAKHATNELRGWTRAGKAKKVEL